MQVARNTRDRIGMVVHYKIKATNHKKVYISTIWSVDSKVNGLDKDIRHNTKWLVCDAVKNALQ